MSGRSTKIKLVGSQDLSFHYLPDRGYFTALLDIRGFLPKKSAIENRVF
ncbi:MAG TPA: hypothetical protein VIQ31_08925 [Phormidium sp.]